MHVIVIVLLVVLVLIDVVHRRCSLYQSPAHNARPLPVSTNSVQWELDSSHRVMTTNTNIGAEQEPT